MFNSIVVANRGEIALRVMRTARRMGYRVIAVYSDADVNAPHVRFADAAARIGEARPLDSYLNIAAIIEAAQATGAEAVHPGYGFLAENEKFAAAVIDAGLTWIGPPPSAMREMGDKAEAKRLMKAADVPCVPGYDGDDQSDATLAAHAKGIGFPLMIKATAGGGGRGMRLVESMEAFPAALASARSEAQAAFGTSTVLLERAIIEPRHVEIQVFADAHGNVVHLGERDCSVQRRHQKVLEEAPSPAFAGSDGHHLRRRMGAMAVAAARAIKYRGAGTIECLLDAKHNFYFMEMNTRLQVEHPVTEALTGYDLVEWQIRVARGEHLPETSQEAILARFETGGHAIEARLCAEDPARDFLPQSGRVLAWNPGDSVRVDHALEPGAEIAPFYDSMIAKFVAHAPSRDSARQKLEAALRAATALGVRTNQAFLAAAVAHETFAAGRATTAFVGRHLAELQSATPAMSAALAGLVLYCARAHGNGHDPRTVALALPWPVQLKLAVDGVEAAVAVQALGAGRYRIACGATAVDLELLEWQAGHARVATPDGRIAIEWAHESGRLFAASNGVQTLVEDRTLTAVLTGGAAAAGMIRAPMAGRIAAVFATVGQQVEKGAPLLVLEAMKMEHPSVAPIASVVKQVFVAHGDQVAAGALLVELAAQ